MKSSRMNYYRGVTLNQFTELKKPVALTDWAYQWIKGEILSLTLSPGAQLNINNLTEELNISRTPIREALLRLEKDGLVRVIPRAGFYVTEITRRDLEELYEIRELLESRAIEEAVNNMSDLDLKLIDGNIKGSHLSVRDKEVDNFLRLEIEFHTFLINHSSNQRLISIMESLHDLTLRWRTLSVRSLENLNLSYEEHQRIAQAVKARDSKKASQLMSEHIRNSQARILQQVENYQESRDNKKSADKNYSAKVLYVNGN
jgi:DNA-binding GntR family transcriptional regulator